MSEACAVCGRNPKRMNSDIAECSHVDCPHRRKAWSEGAEAISRYSRIKYTKQDEGDPKPLDEIFN